MTAVAHRASYLTATIPPTTRKRTAAEAKITSAFKEDLANKKVIASAAIIVSAAPPTPVTTTTSVGMDSEDDFFSPNSSEDELNDSGDALSAADGILMIPGTHLFVKKDRANDC